MSKVIDQYLGVLRGKMGPNVFKMVDGDPYAATAPHFKLVNNDPLVLARRAKFGMTMKLGHCINAIPQLKQFWSKFEVPAHPKAKNVCNKVVVMNYPYASATGFSNFAMLVPEKGFKVTATSITMTSSNITVVLAAIGESTFIDPTVDVSCRLACVLVLSDPTNPNEIPTRLFHFISDSIVLSQTNPMTIEITVDDFEGQYIDGYTTQKALFALISTNADDVPQNYSNTFQS